VAWVVTLAGTAELSCTPLTSPVVSLAMSTAATRGGAQRGTQVGDGVLQDAHLGAFAVGDGETVTAPTGMVTIAAPAPGAQRRPRR
jgi:hypothetical protein